MYNLPDDYYETYLQRLAAVSIDDVSRVAKKYVTPEKARIVVVGNKDEVMAKLTSFDKEDGKIQLYDIYANPKKDESGVPVNVDAKQLIEAYLGAIGGREKLDAVKSLDQTYNMELQGMALVTRMVQSDGKFYMTVSTQGTNFMRQVYDGEKGILEQQGQVAPIEGDALISVKEQAYLFPERLYTTAGYMIEVKGVEDVNGKSCYKLAVTKPSGDKTTEYYDKETFLKVKEIKVETLEGQTMTTISEFSDYKAVDGIMVPHTLSITGPMPMPMVMKAASIKVNATVDPMLFKI
jgi:hypothetical protein